MNRQENARTNTDLEIQILNYTARLLFLARLRFHCRRTSDAGAGGTRRHPQKGLYRCPTQTCARAAQFDRRRDGCDTERRGIPGESGHQVGFSQGNLSAARRGDEGRSLCDCRYERRCKPVWSKAVFNSTISRRGRSIAVGIATQ